MKVLPKDEIERLYADAASKAESYLNRCLENKKKSQERAMQEKDSLINRAFLQMNSSGFNMWMLLEQNRIEVGRMARQRLDEINLNEPEEQAEAKWIAAHEIYVEARIRKECSRDEGCGVSPALDGLFGEKLTVFELELCIQAGYPGYILHNLEFEVGNRTIQIDVVFITQKGVFVIETKNYDGRIHGAEYQDKWTLKTSRKDYQFNNPVNQNRIHINVLNKVIRSGRFYSVIAFNDTSELEYIDIHSRDVFVLNLYALNCLMKDIFENEPDVFSVQEVETITADLRRYCADDPEANPNYKAPRGYFSARTRAKDDSGSGSGKP